MKNLILFTTVLFITFSSFSQEEKKVKLPSVNLKSLDGTVVNSEDIATEGKVVIINFWATWCKPCIKELIAIGEVYEDWQEEVDFVQYAISIDDANSSSRVAPFVNSKGWECKILLDENSEFKRAMNVVNVPHTFVLDKEGNIVWQHAGYATGDEESLLEVIKKVNNGEDPSAH
ncbi:MAG: TlpA family protein disulfide reductase [Bacteroidales bacterium]|nr:TlpA family protein disulfide reductase [Bacteroidales bacterium]